MRRQPARITVFQRLRQRRGAIERAMKGHLQRRRQIDQLAGALGIDRAVAVQHAQRESTDAERLAVKQILADEVELEIGIDEVATPRTQQHVYRKATRLHGLMDQRMTWREAIHVQVGAELDARGAARLRDQAGFQTFGAQLKDDFLNGREHTNILQRRLQFRAERGRVPLACKGRTSIR